MAASRSEGSSYGKLVHVPLEGLMVPLQLPVGLGVEGSSPYVPDAHHAQVVPEGPRHVAGSIVASSLVRSVTGTWSMPVLSTASCTTSMKESDCRPSAIVGQSTPLSFNWPLP